MKANETQIIKGITKVDRIPKAHRSKVERMLKALNSLKPNEVVILNYKALRYKSLISLQSILIYEAQKGELKGKVIRRRDSLYFRKVS